MRYYRLAQARGRNLSVGGMQLAGLVGGNAVQEAEEEFSLVACFPLTGRTHQIRAHLAWRGHPLVADANYNPKGQVRKHFGWCSRLWLHCREMRLKDLEGRDLELSAPVPEDLLTALAQLHGNPMPQAALDRVGAGTTGAGPVHSTPSWKGSIQL